MVCRWQPDARFAVQVLALRDELLSRAFDPPGDWWVGQPGVVGGRDRSAGGSWCVSDVADGVTAVVLNRPERRTAAAGAASRGVLPLAAARYRERWPEFVEVAGMASFNVVLASPRSLCWWSFDGRRLQRQELAAGTYMFTPRGLATSEIDHRFAVGGARLDPDVTAPVGQVWADWLTIVEEATPSDDPLGLIVRRPIDQDSYETVFGQFIAAAPGVLRLDYLNNPAQGTDRAWTTRLWNPVEVP